MILNLRPTGCHDGGSSQRWNSPPLALNILEIVHGGATCRKTAFLDLKSFANATVNVGMGNRGLAL